MPPMSEFVAHTAAAKCLAPDFLLLHPPSRWAHAERQPSRAQLPASTIACTMSDQSKCGQCTRHRTNTRPPGICRGAESSVEPQSASVQRAGTAGREKSACQNSQQSPDLPQPSIVHHLTQSTPNAPRDLLLLPGKDAESAINRLCNVM